VRWMRKISVILASQLSFWAQRITFNRLQIRSKSHGSQHQRVVPEVYYLRDMKDMYVCVCVWGGGLVVTRLIVDEVAAGVDKRCREVCGRIQLNYISKSANHISILSNHISICLGIDVVNLN
jgi:hypothetical protein